jgi:predicted kinase
MKKFLEKITEDEQTHNPVVMTFGRMNPPTIGHEKLVNKVKQIAQDYHAPHHVIVSHSQDAKKNPLQIASKLKHTKRFFPDTNMESSSKESPTFLQHAARLHQMGHDHLVMVAGSDRVDEYQKKLEQYNGEGPGKLFNFKKIEVKSAGERDPDAEGAEGMSASKMREHAKNNDFTSFKQGVPTHLPEKHAKELFRDVRKGMGLNENVNRGLFKAIFVTGGPGSGKDVIIREAIAENKAVELNSVQAFDYLMDKQKLSEQSKDYRREAIRNRGPLIINGPADDHTRMITIKEELEELGYETMMVFVDTTNEASKQRNEGLIKMVAESVRREKWQMAQTSKEAYRQNFESFVDFDNSSTLDVIEEDITETYDNLTNFLEGRNFSETAYSWLENHGKLNIVISVKSSLKENEYVKQTSRFIRNLQERKSAKFGRTGGTGARAEGPSDIKPDNRASDANADNIKWDGNKRGGSYTFRTYTEEAKVQVYPEPKESNFSQDNDKVKNKKRFKDVPSVNQRVRNVTGLSPEFDTRQQGTVYPMSGLGDVTYREEKNFKSFRNTLREAIDDPGANDMGLAGALSGASNKEPMENPKDKLGYSFIKNKKKPNGDKK